MNSLAPSHLSDPYCHSSHVNPVLYMHPTVLTVKSLIRSLSALDREAGVNWLYALCSVLSCALV